MPEWIYSVLLGPLGPLMPLLAKPVKKMVEVVIPTTVRTKLDAELRASAGRVAVQTAKSYRRRVFVGLAVAALLYHNRKAFR